MIVPGAITLREVTASDYDWLLALRKKTMDPHLTAAGIDPLETGHVEAVETDYDWTRVILLDGAPVGMIRTIRNLPVWHLRQIQVDPVYHRKGIGTHVLNQLLDEAGKASRSVVLNVLHVNPARHLYEKLGFRTVEVNDRSQKMQWDG